MIGCIDTEILKELSMQMLRKMCQCGVEVAVNVNADFEENGVFNNGVSEDNIPEFIFKIGVLYGFFATPCYTYPTLINDISELARIIDAAVRVSYICKHDSSIELKENSEKASEILLNYMSYQDMKNAENRFDDSCDKIVEKTNIIKFPTTLRSGPL